MNKQFELDRALLGLHKTSLHVSIYICLLFSRSILSNVLQQTNSSATILMLFAVCRLTK